MEQTTQKFDTNKMFETIEHYETYYKGKRSSRQKYIMNMAIERFVSSNHLENPNQYLLYLIADKNMHVLKSKSEQYMITELYNELEKDIHIFQTLNK